MPLTFIDTNKIPKSVVTGGALKEVLSERTCGAQNVDGWLRWIDPGQTLTVEAAGEHQLLYVMEGAGSARLGDGSFEIAKGAGLYLDPGEGTAISATAEGMKLFHLAVPQIPKG